MEGNQQLANLLMEQVQDRIDKGLVVLGRYNKSQDNYTINYWVRRTASKKLKTVWCALDPVLRPLYSLPIVGAASSTTSMPRFFAIALIASMSHDRPIWSIASSFRDRRHGSSFLR